MKTQAVNSYYDEEIGTVVTVVFTDLDTAIDEQVVFNPAEDSYTIILNSRCSDEAMRSAFEHARGHILHGDLEQPGKPVQLIEAYAHGLADPEEVVVIEEPPKKKQTREDSLSLAECHKRVQDEYFRLYCKNMAEKYRKKREWRERMEDPVERSRIDFYANMGWLPMYYESIGGEPKQ